MRIVAIGGGPAGLFFSLLMKKAWPETEIEIYERNRPDDTFGWGVVFFDADSLVFHGYGQLVELLIDDRCQCYLTEIGGVLNGVRDKVDDDL